VNVLPTVPSDSLYKFVAIFGLVLVGFGLWLPDKFVTADAAAREAYKARELANIRLERKKAQVDRLGEQFEKKSKEVEAKQKVLDEQRTALEAKRKVPADELGAFMEKMSRINDELTHVTDEYEPLRLRQEEFVDEVRAETVELKSANEAADELFAQRAWWQVLIFGSWVLGFVMIVVGFGLWYIKVQVFEDAILRKEAGKEPLAK
jgi:predicted nuclease with TOPRIM domain